MVTDSSAHLPHCHPHLNQRDTCAEAHSHCSVSQKFLVARPVPYPLGHVVSPVTSPQPPTPQHPVSTRCQDPTLVSLTRIPRLEATAVPRRLCERGPAREGGEASL